jgi:uncharacterized protein YndB with AHSA1/START domain
MSDAESAITGTPGGAEDGDGQEIVVSQHVAAPPETLFDYLVDPAKMLRWLGVAVDIDPRPGGKFWFDANGTDSASGEYLEVDRPKKVVFTFGWDGSDAIPPGSTTVTITLATAQDNTTDLELRHTGLPVALSGDHNDGWTYFLGRLAIASTGEDPGPNRHAP